MRLESAITALKRGAKIKRRAWKDGFLTLGSVDFFDEFYIIKVHHQKHNAKAYVFTRRDVVAKDWEVLHEEKYYI